MLDLRKVKNTGIPQSCLLAVWLWRNPLQPVFDNKGVWYVYDPYDKCFYYKNPNNAVRNEWQRARGLDQWLGQAMKYFPELCMNEGAGNV